MVQYNDKDILIIGIGSDIIEIDRIRSCIEKYGDHFLVKLFTEQERLYCLKNRDPAPHFAARFAAKEAVAKALGCGIGAKAGWQDIAILKDPAGKPEVHLAPSVRRTFNHPKLLLSISHCRSYATAFALWVGEESNYEKL
jgi:holo-[acyl-carrier protein] synthase